MGLFDFIKGEFIEVVHFEDESQDTMVYKFPIKGKQQIKENAQLIVRPSQMAIFVYEGKIADVYEPGKYSLNTDTMPIMTTLSNWKTLFENHFKTDVYFINMKQFINQKWGTTNPIMMRDADFGILRLRGFGVFSFRVEEPVSFLKEVFGSNKFYTVNEVNEHLKSLVVSSVSDVLAEAGIPAIDLATQYDEIGRVAQARILERFSVYGLTISDFVIENLSLPESVEEAIDKRTQMGALGDLNQYMKFQTAEAIRDAAKNEGGGMASMGAGMGAGMGIGNMMAGAMAGKGTDTTEKEAPKVMVRCQDCGHLVDENAKFCADCGASMVKKCAECGASLVGNPKFCPECGSKQA